jgi:uncharacterized Zn-binding protein involved in type VI secretion
VPSRVFANGMGLSHARSGGMSAVFPDVCKTPSPGGPVPVPYVNVGRSADVAKGSKRVKIQGVSTMLKGSVYRKSTGDEAGTAGGVASSTTQGECELAMYSFDVKIEGRNVGRAGDLMTHNRKNAVG